jgi:hypothetical protein
MPGLVPGIHVFTAFKQKTWMAGTSPAMTNCVKEQPSSYSSTNVTASGMLAREVR